MARVAGNIRQYGPNQENQAFGKPPAFWGAPSEIAALYDSRLRARMRQRSWRRGGTLPRISPDKRPCAQASQANGGHRPADQEAPRDGVLGCDVSCEPSCQRPPANRTVGEVLRAPPLHHDEQITEVKRGPLVGWRRSRRSRLRLSTAAGGRGAPEPLSDDRPRSRPPAKARRLGAGGGSSCEDPTDNSTLPRPPCPESHRGRVQELGPRGIQPFAATTDQTALVGGAARRRLDMTSVMPGGFKTGKLDGVKGSSPRMTSADGGPPMAPTETRPFHRKGAEGSSARVPRWRTAAWRQHQTRPAYSLRSGCSRCSWGMVP